MQVNLFTIVILLSIIIYFWYVFSYFRGDDFNQIKSKLQNYVTSCNDLNRHIEELKDSYTGIQQQNYGQANFEDNSIYNFKRREQIRATKSSYIYDCSSTVCKNAGTQPFKYICKYFNVLPNEENLEKFENLLNKFSAAEEGKNILIAELNEIKLSIETEIPFLIRLFHMKRFMKNVGFEEINLGNYHFPSYTFRYVSPGGNKSNQYNIKLDLDNITDFVCYLNDIIKFKKSVAGQRSLMTRNLREEIKNRDNFKCQICGVDGLREKYLLLEIDHIIPLSKGGMTTLDNLQTLCWKCNRTKGSKIISSL